MTYSSLRYAHSLRALGFGLLLVACAEDDGNDPYVQMPAPIVNDAQVSVTTDAATAAPIDAGTGSVTDATTPPTGADAQAALDASGSLDAQTDSALPTADAGGGSDASGGNDAAQADAGGPRADLGKGDGKDVIAFGDSWMLLLTSGIQESLVKVSKQPYRKYGFPGTRILNGDIPAQFDRAKRENPNIKTAVMTGGGNDILLDAAGNDCPTGGPKCTQQLDKIALALDALWKKMSESGVQDVVHVMYSASAVKSNPVKNLPAHNERIKQMCESHPPMRCFMMNTDALVPTTRDGIHPTDAGYDAIGKAVFELMTKEGMRR